MPQRSNNLASCTPLGPVEYPRLLACKTACFKASSLAMSGRGAPAGTATATPEWTRSVRLPATSLPSCSKVSMALLASTTQSKTSPAWTRLAASTPPTDSICTENSGAWASNKRARSANKGLVAMEEMMRIGVVVGVVMRWFQRCIFSASQITPQVASSFGHGLVSTLASTLGTYANFGY